MYYLVFYLNTAFPLVLVTNWTSVEIQEEILSIMANHIVLSFAEEVRNCGEYGLIADETSDISQIEQLSICLRIVDNNLSIKENVFGFYALEKCDANSLYIAISDALLRLNISLQNCFGVTFDGASAFSGHSTGVGVRISEIAPCAILTHCHMHCVNLSVQDVVKAIPLMRDFLHLANDLIIFLRNSPKRCAIVNKIAIQLNCPQTHIRPLCPTRFTVKYSALSGIYQQYDVIFDALEEICTLSSESGIKSKANGYIKRLSDFDTCFALCVSLKLFEITDRLSKQLQSKDVSVGEGNSYVKFSISILESMDCKEKFKLLWSEVEQFCVQHGLESAKLPHQRRPPNRFENPNKIAFKTPEEYYQSIYNQIISHACATLKSRITNKYLPVLENIEKLLADSWKAVPINLDNLDVVCKHYKNLDPRRLEAQLLCLENLQERIDNLNASVSQIIQLIGASSMINLLPMVVKMIKFYLVCPASTATAERSFSQLRRLKTYLRSTMNQKRLNSLLILSTYQEEVDKLDVDKLVNEFIMKNDIRRKVFTQN